MRTSFAVTAACLLGAAALSFGLVQFLGAPPRAEEPISHSASAVPIEEAGDNYEYVLKEYKGRLAVFSRGQTEPDMVFDVYVQSLPEFDRGLLQGGIAAEDYRSLVSLIEDYTS